MKAMVLCAGLGTRLRPLTNSVPKPLVPAPDSPLVFHTLDRLVDAGADSLVVNLHHLPDTVRRAIGAEWKGVRVEYSHEPEILGPAGGPRKAAPLFGGEPFLVVNGDVYFEVDFAALHSFHVEHGAALTMAVKSDVPGSKLNAVAYDETLRVRQLWGKPGWSGPALSAGINIGAFVYSPEILMKYVPPDVPQGFREDLIPALFSADEKVFAFPVGGYWCDVGDEASYLGFLEDILDGAVPGITGGHAVSAEASIGESAKIVAPSRISAGAVVESGAVAGPHAVVCEGARIGAGARVSRSLIAPGAVVAADAVVDTKIVVP